MSKQIFNHYINDKYNKNIMNILIIFKLHNKKIFIIIKKNIKF